LLQKFLGVWVKYISQPLIAALGTHSASGWLRTSFEQFQSSETGPPNVPLQTWASSVSLQFKPDSPTLSSGAQSAFVVLQ
jgi:hypothetical protein